MSDSILKAEEFARNCRAEVMQMLHRTKASHIGSCFSCTDILAVLYSNFLRINSNLPNWPERDRFLMSKGHAAAILYAVLAESGFIAKSELSNYAQNGSDLISHISHKVPGIELSTGSLGHALSVGCGIALCAKRENKVFRTVVLLSDGELDEGSNWEAILFAGHHKLNNLITIVDYNKIQSLGRVDEVINLAPLTDKFKSFGLATHEVDGHNHSELIKTLDGIQLNPNYAHAIIANTVKGKGVSFMEDDLAWHYKAPDAEQLKNGLKEIKLKA